MNASRRDTLRLAFAGVVAVSAATMPGGRAYAQEPSTQQSDIGEKSTLCRSEVEEELRQKHLRIMKAFEESGAEITPEHKERIVEQAVDRTIRTLAREYKFAD